MRDVWRHEANGPPHFLQHKNSFAILPALVIKMKKKKYILCVF